MLVLQKDVIHRYPIYIVTSDLKTRSNQPESVISIMPNPSQERFRQDLYLTTNIQHCRHTSHKLQMYQYKYETHTYKVTKL